MTGRSWLVPIVAFAVALLAGASVVHAKTLGSTIPPSVLVRADEILQ